MTLKVLTLKKLFNFYEGALLQETIIVKRQGKYVKCVTEWGESEGRGGGGACEIKIIYLRKITSMKILNKNKNKNKTNAYKQFYRSTVIYLFL